MLSSYNEFHIIAICYRGDESILELCFRFGYPQEINR
uniref:Uncharacterized protein n=1 Tax=Rhizophora mucronata TaxID=61149 RepID=A0A2P2IVY4_RHIMU